MEEPDQNSKKEELRKMVFEHHAQMAERAARNLEKTPMGLKILAGIIALPFILAGFFALWFNLITFALTIARTKIGNRSKPRPVIKVQTDEMLQIANCARNSDIQYVGLPEVTFDKAKGLVKLAWYERREEILDSSEIRMVALGRQLQYITLTAKNEALYDYIFSDYAIYLELNEGKRILIGKERKEKVAELLAATIAQFLNVRVVNFMCKTK